MTGLYHVDFTTNDNRCCEAIVLADSQDEAMTKVAKRYGEWEPRIVFAMAMDTDCCIVSATRMEF